MQSIPFQFMGALFNLPQEYLDRHLPHKRQEVMSETQEVMSETHEIQNQLFSPKAIRIRYAKKLNGKLKMMGFFLHNP